MGSGGERTPPRGPCALRELGRGTSSLPSPDSLCFPKPRDTRRSLRTERLQCAVVRSCTPVETYELGLEGRLLSVDSRRVPLFRFDVCVIGSGAAGSAAALAAAEQGAEVALLCKAGLRDTNTVYAQGGMAAVLTEEDSVESHVADTLRVGCGLSEPARVEAVVRGGPEAVRWLLELGAEFDREEDGSLQLLREGGHSRARIIHAGGDTTGREIQRAVTLAVQGHARITSFEGVLALDILCESDGSAQGVLVRMPTGERAVIAAGQVILASGGAGQIYRETTNPAIATGDGLAIAFRAGAVLRDLEFVQFHPTMLYIAGAARVLISETVRGAGGVLRDRAGERFMQRAHPDAELAPRDVVSRAVFRRMVQTGDTNCYLDLSQVSGDPHRLFPSISHICRFFGIDIATDPVPVRPGAHYMVGGIEVDEHGATSVRGLWAAGECASSGLHGANRMGSNSLLEALVMGLTAGRCAAAVASGGGLREFVVRPPRDRPSPPAGMEVNTQDVTYSLKSLMWRQLGIERERESMEEACHRIALWARAVQELAPERPTTFELINMLTVAHLVGIAALHREESRGVHYRTDYPETSDAPALHTRLEPCFEGGQIRSVRITDGALATAPLQSTSA